MYEVDETAEQHQADQPEEQADQQDKRGHEEFPLGRFGRPAGVSGVWFWSFGVARSAAGVGFLAPVPRRGRTEVRPDGRTAHSLA
ncbi:hypothetical protein GCM10027074_67690 [Streptomyces deserti]